MSQEPLFYQAVYWTDDVLQVRDPRPGDLVVGFKDKPFIEQNCVGVMGVCEHVFACGKVQLDSWEEWKYVGRESEEDAASRRRLNDYMSWLYGNPYCLDESCTVCAGKVDYKIHGSQACPSSSLRW